MFMQALQRFHALPFLAQVPASQCLVICYRKQVLATRMENQREVVPKELGANRLMKMIDKLSISVVFRVCPGDEANVD